MYKWILDHRRANVSFCSDNPATISHLAPTLHVLRTAKKRIRRALGYDSSFKLGSVGFFRGNVELTVQSFSHHGIRPAL